MAPKKKWLSKKRIFLLLLIILIAGGGYYHFLYRDSLSHGFFSGISSSPSKEIGIILPQGRFSDQNGISRNVSHSDYGVSKKYSTSLPNFPGEDEFSIGETQKIIKNASMTLEVDDTEASHQLVKAEIENLEGFITHLNSYETEKGKYTYQITLKIPSEKLEIAIANLESLGNRKSKNFSANDITSQYTDTEGTLENLRNERGRLNELLDTKTDNLADILAVEREISRVQQQITRLQRTQETRENQIAYSNLNLRLVPKTTISPMVDEDWNPQKTWTEAVNKLFVALRLIAEKAIVILAFLPIWLPTILILWFLKYLLWDE